VAFVEAARLRMSKRLAAGFHKCFIAEYPDASVESYKRDLDTNSASGSSLEVL
jgi:hypothetical protein